MRSETKTLIEDDRSAGSVAGAKAPVASLPKRPPLGSVILSFQARNAAASMALEEASSPDWEVPPTIGELAVRIVGRFKLPRVKVLVQDHPRGRDPAPAAAHDPSWEDSDA